jgi:alginate O-acetyltransferase complex protein AlgI
MLFNSFPFLAVFFPIVLIGFFLIAQKSRAWAASWLGMASLCFAAYWSWLACGVLFFSVGVNFLFARSLITDLPPEEPTRNKRRTILIWAALLFNLGLLGYFKYAMFFVHNLNLVLVHFGGIQIPFWKVILPIGISFYTFTQSAFLFDCYHGKVKERSFSHYLLFVTYFPHLIAGPLLHHREMMPQFEKSENYRFSWQTFSLALGIFTLGLAKKVLLADRLGETADMIFDAAKGALIPNMSTSWIGALMYAFQIYFDFSGYSDMAVGLSLFFGVHLPLNFNYPFRATNVIDFWQRWHMSLTRYIRQYVYNPLTLSLARIGEEKGPMGEIVYNLVLPTMGTFFIVGLWHGAGWTYILFGVVHGFYLIVNHFWIMWLQHRKTMGTPRTARTVRKSEGGRGGGAMVLTRVGNWGLTFFCLLIAYIIFRSENVPTALKLIRGMVGLNQTPGSMLDPTGQVFFEYKNVTMLLISLGICLWVPDSIALVELEKNKERHPRAYQLVSLGLGFLFVICLSCMNKSVKFIYFNF